MRGIDWMRLQVMYEKNEKKKERKDMCICVCVCVIGWKERLSPSRKLLS